ncbi:MAG: methyltransferase domain-containing protein [Erythrobacter sp.]|jgi:SAM-dependent methyltransferase|nr:methyltransferase domain-containing protein [Erythrobacter sp.]
MATREVPRIFSARRALLRRERAWRAEGEKAARFLPGEMVEDMIERLAFVRHRPERALVIGDITGTLAAHCRALGSEVIEADIAAFGDRTVIDLEAPYPITGFDFIAVTGLVDAVNDVPGALIHIRNALAPRGLAIVSFIGGASLPRLREAMLAAEPDRPFARIHPLIDPRAAPGLMQRAGWSDPVVDTHVLKVRYRSLARLVADLREQGLASALADAPPPLGKAALARAEATFAAHADADGRTTETFEIVTLTGRRSRAGT